MKGSMVLNQQKFGYFVVVLIHQKRVSKQETKKQSLQQGRRDLGQETRHKKAHGLQCQLDVQTDLLVLVQT